MTLTTSLSAKPASSSPTCAPECPMYKDLVTDNIILRKRVEEVGYMDQDICNRYGATGPVVRGCGKAYDMRKVTPYSVYDKFDFKIPVYHEADAMARYMVRMDEMEESMKIIEQALDQLPEGEINPKKAPKPTWKVPAGETYSAVEGARGKVGIHLVSDGTKNPYRAKLRAPGYCNLSPLCRGLQRHPPGGRSSHIGQPGPGHPRNRQMRRRI